MTTTTTGDPNVQNTQPAPTQDELKQNLLTAAANLREHQLAWIRSAQHIAGLEMKKKQADATVEDSELELAEADAAFATTRLKVLRLIREKRKYSAVSSDLHQNHGDPRDDIWRICATGSADDILAAAAALGELDEKKWNNGQLLTTAELALTAAHEEMTVVSATRRTAVQKRGKAKAEAQAAGEDLQQARNEQPVEGFGYYELLNAVVRAAAAITGTGEKQYAYSYVFTKDLGITGPGLELPSEKMSPEDQARYWELVGYGAKRAPSRDDE